MNMMEKIYQVCRDCYFDELKMEDGILHGVIGSFREVQQLDASEQDGRLEMRLQDTRPLDVTPEVLAFLRNHGENTYPLRRETGSMDEVEETLENLMSAADDLIGFCHDIAEGRHTLDSAESALRCNFLLRDTPQESSQLDCQAVHAMLSKRMLWYPSAGDDFYDLILSSGEYRVMSPEPDLFVHTDCGDPDFDLDRPGTVFSDKFRHITLHQEKEFDRMTVPHKEFAHWGSAQAGRIILYRAEIVRKDFPTLEFPLIYAVCENEWFAAEFLAPNRIAVDTVCRVRYGSSLGGAAASGAWLFHTLKSLHTRFFIADSMPQMRDADEKVLKRYPQLDGVPAALHPHAVIPAKQWPYHGDVTIYKVSSCKLQVSR